MKVAKVCASAALAALVCGFGAPVAQAADAAPIKIGVYLPLTGRNAFGGQLELEGVQLAQKAQPTVLGRPVELVVVATSPTRWRRLRRYPADRTRQGVRHHRHLRFLPGPGRGGSGRTRGRACHRHFLHQPVVTQGKKYYFRACFIDPYQGAAATYAIQNLGFKKAAILMDVASDYSVGLCNFFKRAYTKLGGEMV